MMFASMVKLFHFLKKMCVLVSIHKGTYNSSISHFRDNAISSFDAAPEVVDFGTEEARTAALFYGLLAYSRSVTAILSGTGKAVVPMNITMASWCVIRVVCLAVSIPLTHAIQMVYVVYPRDSALSCFPLR